MGAVEGRKISKNNQVAEVPTSLFLRLMEMLPLPLGHLGPALAQCPGRVKLPLLATEWGDVTCINPTPPTPEHMHAPWAGTQNSPCPQPCGTAWHSSMWHILVRRICMELQSVIKASEDRSKATLLYSS